MLVLGTMSAVAFSAGVKEPVGRDESARRGRWRLRVVNVLGGVSLVFGSQGGEGGLPLRWCAHSEAREARCKGEGVHGGERPLGGRRLGFVARR